MANMKYNKKVYFRPAWFSILLLLTVLMLSGCQSMPSGFALGSSGSGSGLDSEVPNNSGELSRFLSQATTGQVTVLQESPWGSHVTVMVETHYFAASGRDCARLVVEDAELGDSGPALVCQQNDGSWHPVELVLGSSTTRL